MLGRAMRRVVPHFTTTRKGAEEQPSVLGSTTACQIGAKRTA
jgi:hypothetical protein